MIIKLRIFISLTLIALPALGEEDILVSDTDFYQECTL